MMANCRSLEEAITSTLLVLRTAGPGKFRRGKVDPAWRVIDSISN
jgi:hypothetical protein